MLNTSYILRPSDGEQVLKVLIFKKISLLHRQLVEVLYIELALIPPHISLEFPEQEMLQK